MFFSRTFRETKERRGSGADRGRGRTQANTSCRVDIYLEEVYRPYLTQVEQVLDITM